jgi:hypothetical protein
MERGRKKGIVKKENGGHDFSIRFTVFIMKRGADGVSKFNNLDERRLQ